MDTQRILIIEDNDDSYYLIRQLLLRLQYREQDIRRCASLQEVFTEDCQADVVLTDLTLPDSPHCETFEKIRSRFPDKPIIVLTGNDEADFAVKTIKQGAQDYLVKGAFGSGVLDKAIKYALERKKVVNQLAIKTEQVENILDNITDGFYTLDKDWRITYVNKAFEKIFNRSRSEVMGTVIWESFPRIRESKFSDDLRFAADNGTSVHSIGLSLTSDKWLSVSIYPINEGLAVYLLDITEEKELQEKLLNSERKLRAIVNTTSDIIWSIDTDLNVTEANHRFWERVMLVTGKTIEEIGKEESAREMFKAWKGHFMRALNGETFKMIWTETIGGKTYFEEVSFNPIYDSDNNITGISCFSRDITEQRAYQIMIEKQNEQLKKIAWLQSHKVRSHVATILGLSQFVNVDISADPDLNSVIKGIQAAASELDTVVREINKLTINSDSLTTEGSR